MKRDCHNSTALSGEYHPGGSRRTINAIRLFLGFLRHSIVEIPEENSQTIQAGDFVEWRSHSETLLVNPSPSNFVPLIKLFGSYSHGYFCS